MRSLLSLATVSNVVAGDVSSDEITSGGQLPSTTTSGFFRNNDIDPKWVTIAGVFAWLALFLSVFEVIQHLLNFNKPYLQKYVIRIIWMVPIYAQASFLAMKFSSLTIYLDTMRECYEAFVIYSFMKYLTNFLYREMEIDTIIDSKGPVKHLFPFCNLPPMVGGRTFLYKCKHGIFQYIVLRPLTTFIALITELFGVYYNGSYTFSNSYVYLLIINNISQMTALYFLALFYTAYRRELEPMRPLSKFLCIKAVIFMSFFQACIIAFLIEIGVIQDTSPANKRSTIDTTLQDFLICIEMFVAAIAHLFAFSHRPFVDLAAYNEPTCYSFMRVMDFSDERTDITDHVNQIYNRCRTFFRKRHSRQGSRSQDYEVLIPLRPTSGSSSTEGLASGLTKYQK